MRTLRGGKLLVCVLTDLALYLPIMVKVLLQDHEGFCFVHHQEVEDDALQSLVEKLWIFHLYRTRPVQVTRELGRHLLE